MGAIRPIQPPKDGGKSLPSTIRFVGTPDFCQTLRPVWDGGLGVQNQWDFQGPPRTWDSLMVSGTYELPIRIPKDMGMVWEAYHKGVPVLGVPGITLDKMQREFISSSLQQNFC